MANDLRRDFPHLTRVVLGADTIVYAAGRYIGKPGSDAEAAEALCFLSGKWHEVITGIAFEGTTPSRTESAYEITRVKLRQLNSDEIRSYVSTGECMDVAGAYAVQGAGMSPVDKIDGCLTNVIGPPVPLVMSMLRQASVL